MTPRKIFRISSADLINKMLLSATIGIIIAGSFVYSNTPYNDNWGHLWFIKPLILIPLSGSVGGALYYLFTRYMQNVLPKWLLFAVGTLLFGISLWVGTILGLNGTYWN